MSHFFYLKLSLTNIKKNGKTYFPYFLTCVFIVVLFYSMHALSVHKQISSSNLQLLLGLAKNTIGVFSVIFLFYTYSFLMKRRKKEFGLYNILGMEKKHIAKVLFLENIWLFLSSLFVGLLIGVILNKLMFMFLMKVLKFTIPYEFYVGVPSMLVTAVLFAAIFILLYIYSLFQIHLSNPVQLLKGGKVGEKEPKTRWFLAFIGFVFLSLGYAIAIGVKSPMAAIGLFFVAVILVMLGTYALFISGSIVLLKTLRKNKKFYYQTKHFISVSGMIYRMKQHAVGLANICLLSTAVLVMISSTLSLYVGMDNILKQRFPTDVSISSQDFAQSKDVQKQLKNLVQSEAKKQAVAISDEINYTYASYVSVKNGNRYVVVNRNNMSMSQMTGLVLINLSDFNQLEGKNISLKDNEVLFFSETAKQNQIAIEIEGKRWHIKERFSSLKIAAYVSVPGVDVDYMVMNDMKKIPGFETLKESSGVWFNYEFNVDVSDEKVIHFTNTIKEKILKELDGDLSISSRAEKQTSFYELYGGLFFIGIFLGLLCLLATVLIIYYKQISEGYDDRTRFEILQKVGMSQKEIKQTIRSQILMLFFLPVLMAIVHICAAFPIITKLLAMLNLTNVTLFFICTISCIVVFVIIYTAIYFVTARTYYKIVR